MHFKISNFIRYIFNHSANNLLFQYFTRTLINLLNKQFSSLFTRYISRHSANDTTRHVILGTQQFKPKIFAQQIALDMDNCWGILRCIVDTCLSLPEGKYLLLKDPNKVWIISKPGSHHLLIFNLFF